MVFVNKQKQKFDRLFFKFVCQNEAVEELNLKFRVTFPVEEQERKQRQESDQNQTGGKKGISNFQERIKAQIKDLLLAPENERKKFQTGLKNIRSNEKN